MKITFILANADLSGGVRIIAEHARLLHARGHQIRVVSCRPARAKASTILKGLIRGKPVKNPLGHQGRSHFDGLGLDWSVLAPGKTITAADVPDGDLIVATWWKTAEWMSTMPESKGIKVSFLQGYEMQSRQIDRINAVWRLPVRKIVVSNWLQTIARERFNDPTAILVPNGTDTDHFQYRERGPSGRCVIGSMATSLSERNCKRFRLAVATVETLRKRGVDCEFMGFGSSKSRSGDLPAGSRFETRPPQSRIPEIYASCDCWLFTSEYEGYGLPVLEAMACGTPVVATPAGAAPELLASGGGTLVNSDDPDQIADAVEGILNLDAASWSAMSRTARATADQHSWNKVGSRMEAALQTILCSRESSESSHA